MLIEAQLIVYIWEISEKKERSRRFIMFCSKCGRKVNDNAKFCSGCGNPITRKNGENIGYTQPDSRNSQETWKESGALHPQEEGQRCLPAFIVGLIGSIFGMLGGLCTTMCDMRTGGSAPFLLIFCGSIVGIIGACLCLNKAKKGAILEIISGVMVAICAYAITGADFMSVFAMVLLLASGLIGLIDSYIIKRK